MKRKFHRMLCILPLLLFAQGCGTQPAAASDSFSDGWTNRADSMLIYKTSGSGNFITRILDYETMETASLCNKPNCTHHASDCIVHRLGRNVPVFSEGKAYYFIADLPELADSENGDRVLKVASALYSYDLASNTETKLCDIAGGSVESEKGWLLHDGKLWFVSNECSAWGDGNGHFFGTSTNGGENRLQSVSLSDLKRTDYGTMYPRSMLAETYPQVTNSICAMIAGLFENKIYYNVWFLKKAPAGMDDIPEIGIYVSCFDLSDGTFHGQPERAEDIEFGKAAFVSEDYLAIAGDRKIIVYRAGSKEPVVFMDDSFNQNIRISVFDGLLFCENGKVYDLETQTVRTAPALEGRTVLARYADSYIVENTDTVQSFEKIPVSQLVSE